MTCDEIANKITSLRSDRSKRVQEVMKNYDYDMHKLVVALQDKCSHDHTSIRDNGIGHYWKECIYCGKLIEIEEGE